jgi:hypothetical protein
VLGVLLLLGAQCFTGFQFISEEKILSGYYLDPLLVVGLEGMWGTLYYLILLPIFQHIECSGEVCPDGVLEDSMGAFRQMGDNSAILLLSLGTVVSISCFNGTGVAITKYASAAQRSTVDTCRTLVIWFV